MTGDRGIEELPRHFARLVTLLLLELQDLHFPIELGVRRFLLVVADGFGGCELRLLLLGDLCGCVEFDIANLLREFDATIVRLIDR